MQNEVVIHVRAEDDTARAFAAIKARAKKFAEDLERDLKQAGARAGRGLGDGIHDGLKAHHAAIVREADDIGDDVERQMRRSGDRAGDELGQGMQDGFGLHARDIPVIAGAVGDEVSVELERAGRDAGDKLGKGISDGLKSGTRGGGGAGGLIPDAGKQGVKAGAAAGRGFVEAFGTLLMDTADNPKVLGAAALTALTISPIIGGILGGAVVGGAAGLGIVGGFAASALDPRVKGAAGALKDVIEDDLKLAVKPFVPEAIGALSRVRAAWKGLLPDLASIFKQSGNVMDPLIDGILDSVTYLIDGIEQTIGQSGPVVQAFGDMFAEVGDALADLFVRAADDSDTWAAALDFLTGALVAVIDSISMFLEVSAGIIDFFRPIGGLIDDATHAVNEWWDKLTGAGDAAEDTAAKQGELADATSDTTEETNQQISALRELEETMRKQTDPLFEVFDLQVKVRKAQENYNKAVRENGPESAKARKALLDMGKASFELTSALTTAASEGFDGKLTPAMRSALRNAGNTAKQIDALEKELMAAYRAANKWSGTYTQVYVTEYRTKGLKSPSPVYQGYAHGGVVGAANGSMSSGLTMVGESGPELVKLPAGTQVSSNADTQRALSGVAAAGPPPITSGRFFFDPASANKLVRAIMESLRAEIRDQGGNVQTVLGVSGVG